MHLPDGSSRPSWCPGCKSADLFFVEEQALSLEALWMLRPRQDIPVPSKHKSWKRCPLLSCLPRSQTSPVVENHWVSLCSSGWASKSHFMSPVRDVPGPEEDVS